MIQPSDKIKEKLDVVDFVKGYVELKPAGRNFKGLCPFHGEKTPSLIVSKEKQIWHCFGCGLGGDIFKFLMNYENLEFREALKILAEKAGIELKSLSPEEYRQFGVLYDINDSAKEYYLESAKKFPIGNKYLLERGLRQETIDEFEIGFAPNEFDGAIAYLIKKGFKIDDIIRAGIAFKSDTGRVGDRFRGRIMFPIHDHSGKVIGFSGRILPELDKGDMAKYVNSPETPIFNKSKTLYGFWKTKRGIRESRVALLVEGQMDFLMVYQSGVKNVIATSGTALTPEHLKVLKSIADTIVVSFDNDQAGMSAVERSIDLLGENDFHVLILNLGAHKDPADAVKADNDFISREMKSARRAMEFYLDRYLNSNLDKKNKVRAVLSKIQKLWSPVERSEWIRELSHVVSVPETDLRAEMEKLGSEISTVKNEQIIQNKPKEPSRREILCEKILSLISHKDDLKEAVQSKMELFPESYIEAFKVIAGNVPLSQASPETREAINYISLRSSVDEEISNIEDHEEELSKLFYQLELENLRERQERVRREIAIFEAKGDEVMTIERLREFDAISKKMQDIKKKRS